MSVALPDEVAPDTTVRFAWRLDGTLASRTFADEQRPAAISYDRARRPTGLALDGLALGQAYDRDAASASTTSHPEWGMLQATP